MRASLKAIWTVHWSPDQFKCRLWSLFGFFASSAASSASASTAPFASPFASTAASSSALLFMAIVWSDRWRRLALSALLLFLSRVRVFFRRLSVLRLLFVFGFTPGSGGRRLRTARRSSASRLRRTSASRTRRTARRSRTWSGLLVGRIGWRSRRWRTLFFVWHFGRWDQS